MGGVDSLSQDVTLANSPERNGGPAWSFAMGKMAVGRIWKKGGALIEG
jgi:hypothetical protein